MQVNEQLEVAVVLLINAAGSGGRRNTRVEFICGSLES